MDERLLNRFVVGDIDLYQEYGLILSNEYDLGTPEAKTHYVDIPGGNGSIDLTEALTEDVVYNNRDMSFTCYLLDPENIDVQLGKIRNDIHGRSFDFRLGVDPEYTYTGRFNVGHWAREEKGVYSIEIGVTGEPYKTKGVYTYALNGTGGKWFEFESGRMPVHPIVESDVDFTVVWDGVSYECSAGSAYRLHFCTFHEGLNRIYINSAKLQNVTWDDLAEGGQVERIWDGLAETTWDDIQKLLPYEDDPNAIVYISYEWRDL